jgi:tetratricopeptide (TPR) repeat protein
LEITTQVLEDERIREGLDIKEKQERIDLLQRLLMEAKPSGHTPTPSDRRRCGNILRELGILYRSIGEVESADKSLKDGLALMTDDVKLALVKAQLLHELGYLYDDLGQVEEGIALYKQSLELNDRIGNAQGKAATLHCMTIIYASQGQVDEAITLYQQSLELNDRIGNVQGKAATLHCMAMIYADQGQVEEAIALYKQSLELDDRIGDVQGKAATLVMLGQLIANVSEDYNTAISYLQESLEIFQRLKSPSAEIVQSILSGICDRANTLSST